MIRNRIIIIIIIIIIITCHRIARLLEQLLLRESKGEHAVTVPHTPGCPFQTGGLQPRESRAANFSTRRERHAPRTMAKFIVLLAKEQTRVLVWGFAQERDRMDSTDQNWA